MAATPDERGRHGYMFATARHVLDKAVKARQPVQLYTASGQALLGPASVTCHDIGPLGFDTSVLMVVSRDRLFLRADLRPVFPLESLHPRGTELAWMGFPGLVQPELCLFHGLVSGHLTKPDTYLIDGVAINGVSGGPVFDRKAQLIGIFSAYLPNRRPGGLVLPGLLRVIPINLVNLWLNDVLNVHVLEPGGG